MEKKIFHEHHRMDETSLMAYDEIQKKIGERHKIVYQALKELCQVQHDATDSEIMSHLLKQDPNYVRPRRHELVNKFKMVGFSQMRRCKITGSTCRAWKILDRNEKRKMRQVQESQMANQALTKRTP